MQFLKKSSPTQDYSQPKKEHKNSSQQKNYLSIYANYYCFFLLKQKILLEYLLNDKMTSAEREKNQKTKLNFLK